MTNSNNTKEEIEVEFRGMNLSKLPKSLEEEMMENSKPLGPDFEWYVSENFTFSFNVRRTLFSRWKWWISTKLFLPGNYKWLDDKEK